jgi:hypothetical protein
VFFVCVSLPFVSSGTPPLLGFTLLELEPDSTYQFRVVVSCEVSEARLMDAVQRQRGAYGHGRASLCRGLEPVPLVPRSLWLALPCMCSALPRHCRGIPRWLVCTGMKHGSLPDGSFTIGGADVGGEGGVPGDDGSSALAAATTTAAADALSRGNVGPVSPPGCLVPFRADAQPPIMCVGLLWCCC